MILPNIRLHHRKKEKSLRKPRSGHLSETMGPGPNRVDRVRHQTQRTKHDFPKEGVNSVTKHRTRRELKRPKTYSRTRQEITRPVDEELMPQQDKELVPPET